MPKKPQKKRNRFEEGIENFAEEMGALGERISSHTWNEHGESEKCVHRNLGIAGPFLSSLIVIIILGAFIWVTDFINAKIGSAFLESLNSFFLTNLALFFLISIFFSYSSYFSRICRRGYEFISPVFAAAGVAVTFWIAGNMISIVNVSLGIPVLSTIAFYMINGVNWIFCLILFIGYLVLFIRIITQEPVETRSDSVMKKAKIRPEKIRRLYRSGKDKILGGVCGGIGEYFGVDPVLVRLLWVVASFGFGSGILAYIIAWIIIPRNPNHKWKD